MASSPGSRTLGFIASPPAVSRPCGLPFASVVSTFPAPSGRPKPHETSALMSIPGEELHTPVLKHRPYSTQLTPPPPKMLFLPHRTGITRPERLYAFPHQRVT